MIMEFRTLGNTDVKVTPIAFGAWAIGGAMWGGAEKKDAVQAIKRSIDHGITTIDTAPVYGYGQSEELVGEAIRGMREKVQILTKYGLRWDAKKGQYYFSLKDEDGNKIDIYRYAGKESVIQECENSLRRLGTDYIDLYQIHWADPTTPIDETMEAINILLEQGKIRAAGVCNFEAALLKKAMKTAPICSNQVPYSMVRRDIEDELVPFCIGNEKAILAYSPLQRGLLTGKFSPDHHFKEGDTRAGSSQFKKENIIKTNRFLEEIKPIADAKGASLAQLVIRWTLEQPGITVALVGARNSRQVDDNVGAMNLKLTKDEVEEINSKLKQLKTDL